MRVITSDHFVRWANGTGLIALGGLAWEALVPGGGSWSAVPAALLVGVALATAALVPRRATPAEAVAERGRRIDPATVAPPRRTRPATEVNPDA